MLIIISNIKIQVQYTYLQPFLNGNDYTVTINRTPIKRKVTITIQKVTKMVSVSQLFFSIFILRFLK